MRIIESNVRDWTQNEQGDFITAEGTLLNKGDRKDVCTFTGIPATLINVDEKHRTHTTLDVLQAAKKPVLLAVDDENKLLSVLDPRSTFMPDDKFDQVVDNFVKMGLQPTFMKTLSLAKRVIFDLPEDDTRDVFAGDIFRKKLVFERCREGGCYFGILLLRLVCTNGSLVSEKEFKSVIRSANVDEAMCKYYFQMGTEFFIQRYLHDKFFDPSGVAYQASVANYLGMRDALVKVTNSDVADEFFPVAPISEHYEAQGISISSARAILEHLPSGLEYYKCFNILTNGVKRADDMRLSDEITIGEWASDRKLKFVRANNVSFEGVPHFNETYVRHLMGDVA